MPLQIRIELMGGLRVSMGGHVIHRFTTHKGASLLAYLAYHLPVRHPREVLANLCWPNATSKSGRTSLNDALSSLRGQLEPPNIPHGSILQGNRQEVWLNPDVVTTDVLDFKDRLKVARGATSPDECAQCLSDAIKLYQGELLPGFYEDWVIQEQRHLADVYFDTLNRLIAHFIQTREYAVALEYAHRAVRVEPLSEKAHGQVMRLYVALNQPTAALQHYRELESLLKTEVKAVPSSALRQLAHDIEHQLTSSLPSIPMLETPRTLHIANSRITLETSTLTFLATDTDSSEPLPDGCAAVLRAGFTEYGGYPVRETGTAFLVAFTGSSQALACAMACQQALTKSSKEEGHHVRIRMALHTGDVSQSEGGYDGAVMEAVRRIAVAAQGGQVLCSQTTAELLRHDLPLGVLLSDLGLYRLQGASLPERIFQVVHPKLPREFPALRLEAGYQSRLPVRLTRFFGREEEIVCLQQMLSAEDIRLVTLTGSGGAGKTRLSLEVAYRLLETFAGAVWFVPLADVSDARLIVKAVADAMGLKFSPLLEPLQQVMEALERQRSLLILDNFEQVADEGASIIRSLLEGVSTLTCFVTSRQPLALTGEREFLLTPLGTPGAVNTPETLALYDSVRLFIDRAQAVRPDFQVTKQNAFALAELCNRLEGIPLAIELAAARAQTWTPAQMLVQMGHRFEILVSRKRDIEARHQTLRAAIDWSYQLLPSKIQDFFARLSVFRGGWTIEAAGEVCGAGMLGADYLEYLRERSLVQLEEGDPAGDEPVRFRMLETLQEYAREKLTPEAQSVLGHGHAEFFLRIAQQAAGVQRDQQTHWLDCLEADHDNLRAALEWTREHDPDLGLRLAASLPLFWDIRGYWREGCRYLTDLLERTQGQEPLLRARTLLALGNLAQKQGDYLTARDVFQECFRILESLDHQGYMALVWNSLGTLAQDQGDSVEARRCLEASLAIKLNLEDLPGAAKTLSNLGYLTYLQGDVDVAQGYLERAIATLRGLDGEKQALANALNNLGGVIRLEGDYPVVHALLEESLNLRLEIGDQKGLVYSFVEYAYLAAAQEERMLASQLLAAAETRRIQMDFSLSLPERGRYDGLVALLRRELGDAEFEAEWQQGLSLTLDQVVAVVRRKQTL